MVITATELPWLSDSRPRSSSCNVNTQGERDNSGPGAHQGKLTPFHMFPSDAHKCGQTGDVIQSLRVESFDLLGEIRELFFGANTTLSPRTETVPRGLKRDNARQILGKREAHDQMR